MVAKAIELPTLVLNRNWQPVNVATVGRALMLLWNESARVVDPNDYRTYTWADWSQLRGARRRSVHSGDSTAATDAGSDRASRLRSAAERCGELQPPQSVQAGPLDCQYCGVQPGVDELTIDHVVPAARRTALRPGKTACWRA